MKNYAGHRLSPWLGHLMVSRQETARPLLTPGEVMQLPPSDEIVMVAGMPPDPREEGALLRGRRLHGARAAAARIRRSCGQRFAADDWSAHAIPAPPSAIAQRPPSDSRGDDEDPTEWRACAASPSCPSTRPSRRTTPAVENEFDTRSRTSRRGRRRAAAADQRHARGRPAGRPRSRRRHRAVRPHDEAGKKQRLSVYLDPTIMKALADYAARRDLSRSLDRRGGDRLVPVAGRRRAAGGGDRPGASTRSTGA